MLQENKLQK
jgi:hypothetical protein